MLIIRFCNNFFELLIISIRVRITSSSDEISISESSSRKLFIVVSLITLVRTYCCCCLVFSEIHRLAIHGRWSEMLLNIMEDEMATCFLWGVLQNIWSMRLHECLANLVGKLILGKKLLVHIKSKKSPTFSRSEICNGFMSPTIITWIKSKIDTILNMSVKWW